LTAQFPTVASCAHPQLRFFTDLWKNRSPNSVRHSPTSLQLQILKEIHMVSLDSRFLPSNPPVSQTAATPHHAPSDAPVALSSPLPCNKRHASSLEQNAPKRQRPDSPGSLPPRGKVALHYGALVQVTLRMDPKTQYSALSASSELRQAALEVVVPPACFEKPAKFMAARAGLVNDFSRYSAQELVAVMASVPHELGLSRFSAQELARAIAALPQELEELDLTACGQHMTDALLKIAVNGKSNLKVLKLAGCTQLTDLGVEVLKHNSELTEVDLTGLVLVTDDGFGAALEGQKRLERLSLSGCHVTDHGFAKVVQNMPELQVVNASGCPKLTDDVGPALSNARRLTALDLSECEGVGDKGVIAACKDKPRLQTVDLSFSGVTDAALHDAFNEHPKLKSVEVIDCEGVTEDGIAALRKRGIQVITD
jgi:hypothetical protein